MNLDALDDGCAVSGPALPSPPASVLAASVEPLTLKTGATAAARLAFTNLSARPVQFDVVQDCTAFATYILTLDKKPVSFVNDCALGALCGGSKRWRVTLAPGGTARGTVEVKATVTHVVPKGDDACEERQEGPVAPGNYVLSTDLPFSDMNANGNSIVRAVESPLTVVP